MENTPLTNGEVLRLPITVGSEAGTFSGKLTTVRTATTDAVSHTCADASFSVKVTAPEQPVTDLTALVGVSEEDWNAGGTVPDWAGPSVTTRDGRQTALVEKYEETTASTGIDGISTTKNVKQNDKYMENGMVVIYRDGKRFSVTGVQIE